MKIALSLLVTVAALTVSPPNFAQASPPQASAQREIISLLKPGNVLILGDLHGTKEIPEFTQDLIRKRVSAPGGLVLGLELDADSRRLCDDSGDLPASWGRERADGRTSAAMRELTCVALKLEVQSKLTIVFLDGDRRDRNFDKAASERFAAALKERPGATGLILVGNWHTRKSGGTLAANLTRLLTDYRVVTATASSAYAAAIAWQCQADGCGSKQLSANLCRDDTKAKPILVKSIDDRWDMCVVFRKLSASLPVDSSPRKQVLNSIATAYSKK